jgi:putative pyoverdin transport system ATP-binding/permease protein
MKRLLKMVFPLIGKGGLLKYVFLGIGSGLCSFLFVNTVTRVVGLIIAGSLTSVSKEYIIIFSLIIICFIWIRRTLSLGLIHMSQIIIWKLRKQILSLILDANYQQLVERRAKVQSAIMNDVNILLDVSLGLIDFCTSLILAICCLIYLSSLSLVLFGITLVIASIGVLVYHFNTQKNIGDFKVARQLENSFFDHFISILDGFKEIFMEPKKGRYIFDHKIDEIADATCKSNISAFTGFLNNQITGQVLFYILISSVLLFFSVVLKIRTSDTVSFIFTLLYLLGAIEMVMVLLPRIARAKVSSANLTSLRADLEDANFSNPIAERYIQKDEFNHLEISQLTFNYGKDEKAFGIGPIDFDVQKGETIFIYGGNGSGKTTFVHSLLGLCTPSSGTILLNGVAVTSSNYPEYRTIFSVVFSDFYLFSEIPGTINFNIEKWDYYIRLFELEGKVTLDERKLSTVELSTGQRKRLALILALMEEKPVMVMDEWAADQDPYFRKKFYTEIIPLMKKNGITILAITHDDKYYYCADRLFKMTYGKLEEEKIIVYESDLQS